MPHVASDPKISSHHAHRPQRPAAAEAAPTPFETLVDDASAKPAPAREDNRAAPKVDEKPEAKTEPKAKDAPDGKSETKSTSNDDAQAKDAVTGSDVEPETASAGAAKDGVKIKAAGEIVEAPTEQAPLETAEAAPEIVPPINATTVSTPAVALQIAQSMSAGEKPTTDAAADVTGAAIGTGNTIQAEAQPAQTAVGQQTLEPVSGEQLKAATRQLDKADHSVRDVATPAQLDKSLTTASPQSFDANSAAQANATTQTAQPVSQAAAAAPVHRAPEQTPPVPVEGIAVEIANRALLGKNRFEIRLDPPELGRIDVRLDVDRHGNVSSRLIVDRPETLNLLRHDAPALERALQDAGLKTAGDSLQFSLRDQSAQQYQAYDEATPGTADEPVSPEIAPRAYTRIFSRGGVDIHV